MKNLKSLREERGLTQEQLGEMVGSYQQRIESYENNKTEPSFEMCVKLATALETTVEFLIGNTVNKDKIEPRSTFDLNEDEAELLHQYRLLFPEERQHVKDNIKLISGVKKRL